MAPSGKASEDSDPTVQEQRSLDKLQTCNHSKEWLTNRETGTWVKAQQRTSSPPFITRSVKTYLYTLVSLDTTIVLVCWCPYKQQGCKSLAITWLSSQIVNLIRRIIMFGYTIVNRRFSDAVEFAAVNVLQGRCIIRFKKSGAEYLYKNVSRRRLLSLLLDNNKSLGFWIQYLSNNAIIENRYRPQTGAMTYRQIGYSYFNEIPKYLAVQSVATGV